jgi:hypothetical protein
MAFGEKAEQFLASPKAIEFSLHLERVFQLKKKGSLTRKVSVIRFNGNGDLKDLF